MGLQGVAVDNLFSGTINPAVIALDDSSSFGVNAQKLSFYGQASFATMQYARAFKSLGVQIGLANFGNSFYNLTQSNIGIRKRLSNQQSIGLSFNYQREFVYLQADAFSVSGQLGYQNQLSTNLRLGVFVSPIFYNSDVRMGRNFTNFSNRGGLGLYYNATKKLDLSAEVVVNQTNEMRVGAGLCYKLNPLDLLFGLSSQEGLINAGFGIPLKRFKLNMAYGFRQSLGSGVQVSLIYK